MKKAHLIAIISVTTVIFNTVNGIPQNGRPRRPNQNFNQNFDNYDYNMNPIDAQSNPSETQLIQDIFGSPQQQPQPLPPTRSPSRGAGVIVTPDPNFIVTPTTSPQMLFINQQNCTCVPYHMCDPKTNTVRNQESNDEETGYGVIDIRFNPNDCQDVLDVCCIGAATIDASEPVPVEPPKPPQAGCGVRNVGGLDFQVAGAFVSKVLSPSLRLVCLFIFIHWIESILYSIFSLFTQNNEASFGEFPWTVALIRS